MSDLLVSGKSVFKNKYALYGIGGAIVLFIGYRFMSGGQSGGQSPETSVNGLPTPDPSIVASAQQYALADKQINSNQTIALAQLSNDIELANISKSIVGMSNDAALNSQNSQQGYALNAQESAQDYEFKSLVETNMATKYGVDSAERIHGANIWLGNAELSVKQNLGEREIIAHTNEVNQSYNLQNYQTMVQHDLGKKNIKASYNANVIGSVGGLVGKLFGK